MDPQEKRMVSDGWCVPQNIKARKIAIDNPRTDVSSMCSEKDE